VSSRSSFYESAGALEQYLFFHYGDPAIYIPHATAPRPFAGYPWRAPRLLVDFARLPGKARALDLGCATGATSFELSRHCKEVVGMDLSASFIRAARLMQAKGTIKNFRYTIEGSRKAITDLRRPAGARPERVTFLRGDAMQVPESLGRFDLVVLLNLIDRVPDPAACIRGLVPRLNPGAQLVIASPFTWLEEYTPRTKWLGGRGTKSTREALTELLTPGFRLIRSRQIPFIIREHARKYQWSIADGTTWIFQPGRVK